MARRHSWEVEHNTIVWLNGLVPALNLFCRMAGEPGDGESLIDWDETVIACRAALRCAAVSDLYLT